jgi:hypothetical protein
MEGTRLIALIVRGRMRVAGPVIMLVAASPGSRAVFLSPRSHPV